MLAAVRLTHPAPAIAVVAVSAALGVTLALQAARPLDLRVGLIVLSVAGSQVATGALNDWVDRDRDRRAGRRKPVPDGELSARAALLVGIAGLGVQLATSALLGAVALALAVVVSLSAQLYNFALSRTPLSVAPYLVSFGLLPAWIAAGVGVPFERVATASALIVPFAGAAHLANALQDFDSDERERSRDLAQLLGRQASRLVTAALAMSVGLAIVAGFAIDARPDPAGIVLGFAGMVSVAQGLGDERRLWYGMLIAGVLWAAAWGISRG